MVVALHCVATCPTCLLIIMFYLHYNTYCFWERKLPICISILKQLRKIFPVAAHDIFSCYGKKC